MIVLALGLALCKEQGVLKSEFLRTRSLASPHHVMKLSPAEIQEYVLTFPRPYDVVIYFSSKTSKLSREMQEEFYYLADLYVGSGCLYPSVEDGKVKSAVYFLEVEYGLSTRFFFDLFEFSSAPNLVVSNPRMAILSQAESKRYLKSVKWEISYNDGHVTTHKMLEFTNQRTLRDVVYRPTLLAMLQSVVLFLAVSLGGYYLVTRLRSFYLNPKVWFGGTLLLYFVCTSGIIFVIHQNVPSVGYDKEGNVQVFSNELHMQYGM
jgi:oligosaccharyltransferase complex subunit gamma